MNSCLELIFMPYSHEPCRAVALILSCGIVYTIDTSVDSSRVVYYYTVDIPIPITYTYSPKTSLLINQHFLLLAKFGIFDIRDILPSF